MKTAVRWHHKKKADIEMDNIQTGKTKNDSKKRKKRKKRKMNKVRYILITSLKNIQELANTFLRINIYHKTRTIFYHIYIIDNQF